MPRPLPHRHHGRRTPRHPASGAGFTLVELLVGTLLGSVVLGALGGALMVAELRVGQRVRLDSGRRDGITRVMTMMQNEASRASGLDSVATSGVIGAGNDASSVCNSGPSLRIYSSNALPVCYKSVPLSASLGISYMAPSAAGNERPWRGPCILVREGVPLDGQGDTYVSTVAYRQIVLDEMPAAAGGSCQTAFTFGYTLSAVTGSTSTTAISTAATITIRQATGGNPVATTFSLRTASNPANYGIERCKSWFDASTSTDSCTSDNSRHRRLQFPDVVNQPSFPADNQAKINYYYFNYPRSYYQLSADCAYSSCTLTAKGSAITLQAVDALLFSDQEVRP
jgi:hypothetical protein